MNVKLKNMLKTGIFIGFPSVTIELGPGSSTYLGFECDSVGKICFSSDIALELLAEGIDSYSGQFTLSSLLGGTPEEWKLLTIIGVSLWKSCGSRDHCDRQYPDFCRIFYLKEMAPLLHLM